MKRILSLVYDKNIITVDIDYTTNTMIMSTQDEEVGKNMYEVLFDTNAFLIESETSVRLKMDEGFRRAKNSLEIVYDLLPERYRTNKEQYE